MLGKHYRNLSFAIFGALTLSGCEDVQGFNPFKPAADTGSAETTAIVPRLEEREVEAPEVFEASETGLWDGRPDFGGVWVAYPGVAAPEQVIIRNEETGSFVIGALFNRERDNPGPRFMVSSDAASALGLLAGQPTLLKVTALRRKQVEVLPELSEETVDLDAPEEIEVAPLEGADIAVSAAAAIERAEESSTSAETAPITSNLSQPFIQVGVFSVQQNAESTAAKLTDAGAPALVKSGEIDGKPFWRIIVGPATSAAQRDSYLETVKGFGFTDALFVKN